MSAVQESFDYFFFSPVAAVRLLLVEKCSLILLALDLWFVRLGSINRYDENELSLAHFDWLDALGPIPSAGLYVCIVVLAGVLALSIAIANLGTTWRLALVLLYSYTWAMSRLDSFQHHYLLSWVLLCIAFFPHVGLADFQQGSAQRGRSPVISAWAWVLLGALAAIIYAYTAVAKLDPIWQSGACIQQLQGTATLLKPLESAFVAVGGVASSFWKLVAKATVVVELVLAAGYLLMPWQDRQAPRWVGKTLFICWLLAIGLHSSFEIAGLRIGWFSYFMILLATASFLPARWLEKLVRPLTLLRAPLETSSPSKKTWQRRVIISTGLLSLGALLIVAWWSDLPGIWPATVLGSIGFAAALVDLQVKGESNSQWLLPIVLLVASILLAAAIDFGEVRSKFYPYRLAQLQRRGDFSRAAQILPKAKRYLDNEDIFAQNNLAWFYATIDDESLRDGTEAIKHAKRTCELCEYGNASALDSLACAYATSGDFERSLDTVRQAKVLLQEHSDSPVYKTLLDHERLFSTGSPYIEKVRYRYAGRTRP